MREAQRSVVLNLTSGRAIEGARNGKHYAASGAEMVAMTKTLALEWAQSEIREIAIIPGVSETQQPLKAPGVTLKKLRERGAKLPLGRVGHLSDIAVKVMMLLSKEASFVIGQSIAINSGAIMRP